MDDDIPETPEEIAAIANGDPERIRRAARRFLTNADETSADETNADE